MFSVPALVTHVELGTEKSTVRGVARRAFSIGTAPFDTLRFCLANFPEYVGMPVRYERGDHTGFVAGRLQVHTEAGECRLDRVPEAGKLVERAKRDAGIVISHVGQWIPASGVITVQEAQAVITYCLGAIAPSREWSVRFGAVRYRALDDKTRAES